MIEANFAARVPVKEKTVRVVVEFVWKHRERIVDAGPQMRWIKYLLKRLRNTRFPSGRAAVQKNDGHRERPLTP